MRQIKLYSAMSLDGKIARADGDIGWLNDVPNPDGEDHGYAHFIETIDTTIMGHNTYKQVLGFDVDFPYKGKKNFVLTRDPGLVQDENVSYVSGDIPGFIHTIRKDRGKDIWLIGGCQANTLFLNHGLIHELWLFIIPIIIGDGIPLFDSQAGTNRLQLVRHEQYNTGITGVIYKVL